MNATIEKYKAAYKNDILTVWERSVLATHHFLSPTDFEDIKAMLHDFDFDTLQVFCARQADKVIGFIALQEAKIEMLFVDPEFFGKGLGYKLMQYVIINFQANAVDVNEQNIAASLFYQKLGFETYERTEKDDFGNDYPLLRMKLNEEKSNMRIISVRENPEYQQQAIQYLQNSWSEVSPVIYENCITHCINAEQSLPQWYLLEKEGEIIGCAGLITNDFISRMDLYPWVCAIFVDEAHRGNNYGNLLIEKAKKDSKAFGFTRLNLSTDHVGYYEKFGFQYIGQGYHPWEEESRIYQIQL